MKADAVLLFLISLRYAYEKNPLRYAIVKGFLEQFPETLPDSYRSPLHVIKLLDSILGTAPRTTTRVRVESLDDPIRQLQEFARAYAARTL